MTTLTDLIVVTYDDGTIVHYDQERHFHREDGPAVAYPDGTYFWYNHGERHCLSGPAVKMTNGFQDYYINGQRYTEDEFKVIVFSLGINYET